MASTSVINPFSVRWSPLPLLQTSRTSFTRAVCTKVSVSEAFFFYLYKIVNALFITLRQCEICDCEVEQIKIFDIIYTIKYF